MLRSVPLNLFHEGVDIIRIMLHEMGFLGEADDQVAAGRQLFLTSPGISSQFLSKLWLLNDEKFPGLDSKGTG